MTEMAIKSVTGKSLKEFVAFDTALKEWGIRQYSIEELNISDLSSDPNYQRATNESRVRRIAKNLIGPLCGFLLVSLRDNRYWIVDGCHRAIALNRREIERWPCVVLRGLTASDEAFLFEVANTTSAKPRAIDLFKSRIFRGDPVAVKIKGEVDAAGFSIDFDGTGGGGDAVACVAALERIHRLLGTGGVGRVLRLVGDFWPTNRVDRLSNVILVGISLFLRDHGRAFDKRGLVRKLAKVTPNMLKTKASAIAEGTDLRGPNAIYAALLVVYNKSKQKHKRLAAL